MCTPDHQSSWVSRFFVVLFFLTHLRMQLNSILRFLHVRTVEVVRGYESFWGDENHLSKIKLRLIYDRREQNTFQKCWREKSSRFCDLFATDII